MEFSAFFAVSPEILCQKHTPVALVCQYVLHIFVLLFKFDYADICKMTKIRRAAQQKSPTAWKRLDISIKRTLKIGHRLGWFCAMQQRKEPVTFFMSQALGAPEETRTPDLLIRSQTLYPAELPALVHRVCCGTFIIIPPECPNVKHFFKIFCGFRKILGFARSYVILFASFLLAVCSKRPYTRIVYYRFGCDIVWWKFTARWTSSWPARTK